MKILVMIFLATLFMWPDSIYRMNGDLEKVRKYSGGLFAVVFFMTLFNYI